MDNPVSTFAISSGSLYSHEQERPAYQVPITRAMKINSYTVENYHNLPDDERYELIDGNLIKMETPTVIHQMILSEILSQVGTFIYERKENCLPLISPLDVQLDKDDKTMLQPDLIIVCDQSIVKKACVFGAPDFILEVLSLSTMRKDIIVKSMKYSNAGVKEYWMIDPNSKKIYTWDFTRSVYETHTLEGMLGLSLINNECLIDLSSLKNIIESFDE